MKLSQKRISSLTSTNDLEHDGQRINQGRDPPDPSRVYIPPGDTRKETYRLATFKDFPIQVPVDPLHLAKSGFFYTGYRDRVKCFSCGQNVENWLLEDEETDPGWHQQSCRFVNGTDTTNIPIGIRFSFQRLQARRTRSSIQEKSLSRINGSSSSQASLSSSSHTIQSFPTLPQQRQTSNNETAIRGNDVREINTNSLVTTRTSRQSQFASAFPCQHPINPHMRSKESRMQTFVDNIQNWPANQIQATPQEIAEAGLFYLGERDRVKCWYCNGGLQNWERDDLPWEEHAKWFPMCEYVLQQKGPEFVHRIVSRYPGLRRPSLYNPSTSLSARRILREVYSRSSRSNVNNSSSSSAPEIVDPREELRERKRKIDEDMKSSLVSQIKNLGFEDHLIRLALQRNYENGGKKLTKIEELVDSILSIPEEEIPPVSNQEENRNSSESSTTTRSPRNQLFLLEESRRCKTCRQEEACVVFIPCGHLPCCVACSDITLRCPICKETAREKVRSYIS